MTSSELKTRNQTNGTDKGLFYIVGPRRLHNDLLSSCLERKTGNNCFVLQNFNHFFTANPDDGNQPKLILCDCHGLDVQGLLKDLKTFSRQIKSSNYVVLFNVSSELEFKKSLVSAGIRGFFYEHDSLDHFIKGVKAVLKGKLWFSREIMEKSILEKTAKNRSSNSSRVNLTERQIEILALVSVGAGNDEIADRLCISPHTVKTHLYKIFKKIKVPNRVQASLWAAKNL